MSVPSGSIWAGLHPACVHFPVALLIVGAGWEAWGYARSGEPAIRAGGVLIVVGTLALLPTIVTGYIAANSVPIPAGAATTFSRHELNGWIVAAFFVALLFWKGWYRGTVPTSQRTLYAVALLIGIALVVYSALLGGRLVYVHGVGAGLGSG